MRKKVGLFLLGLVLLYWLAFPVIPFLDIPHKAAIMSGMVLLGEAILLIAIAVLGKEYYGSIKSWVSDLLSRRCQSKPAAGIEDQKPGQ